MNVIETNEYVREKMAPTIDKAYADFRIVYDSIGELVDAMGKIAEHLSLHAKGELSSLRIETALDRANQVFFNLDEARESIDNALGILIADGVALPRFPEL